MGNNQVFFSLKHMFRIDSSESDPFFHNYTTDASMSTAAAGIEPHF
jgi:hypothetical protein